MPRYQSTAPALPRRTLDYLQRGAPEGTRNAELFDAACQFRDAGHSLEPAEEQLLARALADGLSESEARQTIRSAYARTSREPAGAGSAVPVSHPSAPRHVASPRIVPPMHERSPLALPTPGDDGFIQLIDACFKPDEFVSIATAAENEDGEIAPRLGVTLTAAEWKARVIRKGCMDRVFSTKLGLFLRINPMCKDGATNEEVTAFRHVLVEFDRDEAGEPIPKEEQYRTIMASGMPVSALIDSGNKSLHAWVRVDAPDKDEYARRVDIIWNWFEGRNLDKQNRNASRLSRCPDGRRTVDGEIRRQSLLATSLGAESWESWEGEHSSEGSSLFIDLKPFIENGCEPEVPTIADVGLANCLLYAGRMNEIHGEPGTGKSNLAIATSIAVMKAGGGVLYIDPEDTPAGFTRRSLQFGAAPDDLIHRCHYLHNPAPEDIAAAQRWAAANRPALVVLDGMAESMASEGLVEDKAGDVLQFFRERLRPFAEKAGAAVLVSDHVSKSSEERGRWARGSGAKLGRYDGVSYNIGLIEAYAPGHAGAVKLTVAKDRNGGVGRVGQTVAEIHFTPEGDNRTLVSFRMPEGQAGPFRPTAIMQKILTYLREHNEATARDLRTLGKSQAVDLACQLLQEEGSILLTRNGKRHLFTLRSPCTYRLRKKTA
jgi:hypothetical protein